MTAGLAPPHHAAHTHSKTPGSPVAGDLTTTGHTWDLGGREQMSETCLSPRLHQIGAYPTVQTGGGGSRIWWGHHCGQGSGHAHSSELVPVSPTSLIQSIISFFPSKASCDSPQPQ